LDHPTVYQKLDPPIDQRQALLRERQVVQEYGLPRPWLRKRRFLRLAPAFVRIRRMVLYQRTDIDEFIAAHRVEPGGPSSGEVSQ
jgi:predicted DNA-binding transcriptional regulator AlpA